MIYTENGSKYHNYTFYIKRENAPAEAPLENLVLTPMTNGLYKELLISYNLAPQEKQTVVCNSVQCSGRLTIIMDGGYNTITYRKGLFNITHTSRSLSYDWYPSFQKASKKITTAAGLNFKGIY